VERRRVGMRGKPPQEIDSSEVQGARRSLLRKGGRSFDVKPLVSHPSEIAHMNVIRDPVGRCVSRFYYERDARGTFGHDETLDECMRASGKCQFEAWKESDSAAVKGFQRFRQFQEECASNYLSRWFCGMHPVCHRNVRSREVLERAKRTVAEGYTFVGLTSEMRTNFAVLQRLLPTYFSSEEIPTEICNKCKPGMPEHAAAAAAADAKELADAIAAGDPEALAAAANASAVGALRLQGKESGRAEGDPFFGSAASVSKPAPPPPPKVSPANEERIAVLNALDLELYAFAEALFRVKAEACGVTVPGGTEEAAQTAPTT